MAATVLRSRGLAAREAAGPVGSPDDPRRASPGLRLIIEAAVLLRAMPRRH